MWNILRRTQNPYLFSKFGEEVRKNMESLCVNTMILKEGNTDKKMNSHKMRGKMKSFWNLSWKRPLLCKTCDFHNWIESQTSHQSKPPNTFETKFWRICLSVFCDWKVHPQASHEGSRETLWVYIVTRASTCEQVTKLSFEKSKNPAYWKKFLGFFHD